MGSPMVPRSRLGDRTVRQPEASRSPLRVKVSMDNGPIAERHLRASTPLKVTYHHDDDDSDEDSSDKSSS